MEFYSILFDNFISTNHEGQSEAPPYFHDLNLDQIIDTIVEGKKEYGLKPYFYTSLHDKNLVLYRQAVMKELECEELLSSVKQFAREMQNMREHLRRKEKLRYLYQKEYCFLESARVYCEAVQNLSRDLSRQRLHSEGFLKFREFLDGYKASNLFQTFLDEVNSVKSKLNSIKYNMIIRGACIKVCNYQGEQDYSAEIEKTFEKFRQGVVKNYLNNYQTGYDMNHVEAAVLDLVAKLNPGDFRMLDRFCEVHKDYLNEGLERFDREIQFYIAYIDYMERFKRYGLSFCYPKITETKGVYNQQGFDLALTNNLMKENLPVVCNDFYLEAQERIIVVTGPNQGGKTTFARFIGQLNHLAGIGCMVPGTDAQLYLHDQIFSHFEKEEKNTAYTGKLKDDLVRIYEILLEATPGSMILINEIFSSATLKDAIILGRRIMDRIIALDLLCVCVTFIDELASYHEKIVSMASTVLKEDPSARTFKIIRKPADGLAYAISIAEKYRLTYEDLKERIRS